jgi:oxazoline/thiazoline dehydrogenase
VPASLLLSWREGVSVESNDDGEFRLSGPTSRITLRDLTPPICSALHKLASPGGDEDQLADFILDAGGSVALAEWYHRLKELWQRGFLCRAVGTSDRRLVTLLPVSPSFVLLPLSPIPDRPYQLSRFAYLRRTDRNLVLESPLAHARLILDEPRVAGLIAALVEPVTLSESIGRATGLSPDAIPLLLGIMASAGMIQIVRPGGADAEDEPQALRSWQFHDLLFHSRIRQGRSDAQYGATYRLVGQLDPPQALKPEWKGEGIDLYRPNAGEVGVDEPPFAELVARRRSIREYGPRPITDRQLGEFLFRVAWVTGEQEVDLETPRGVVRMGFASRPYPAGGGLYELEFYVAVQACDGLAPGLYHYDPRRHRLDCVCGHTADVGRLVADAAGSAGIPTESVQVVVILTSRFQRIAWKYASIAYALTLKHVGVVYQTMYLTATSMNLAPCALGGGDADLFARAAGTDYYAETSVGEFLLGSVEEKGAASRRS